MSKVDEIENSDLANMMYILINAKDLTKGEQKIIKCKNCGSDLVIGKASNNGHIHAKCCGCGISLIQ